MLVNAPTGISWETIPSIDATSEAQLKEQTNICWRATSYIDSHCNQVLRATVDTEELLGPDYRLAVDNNGLVRALTARWPIIAVLSAQYSSSLSAPANWLTIPANALFIENPMMVNGAVSPAAAAGSAAIRVTPGYVTRGAGRNGIRLQFTYVNGWPHAGIVADAAESSMALSVDDCTGMVNNGIGQSMFIFDGENTELVTAASTSVASGPGTLTIASPLLYDHAGSATAPIIISAIPQIIQEAAILHCAYQALVRGATATTVQNMPGSITQSGSGESLLVDVDKMLVPFTRVI